MQVENLVVRVTADTEPIKHDLAAVRKAANAFSLDLSGAFDRVIFKGRSFSDVLRTMASTLSTRAFHAAFQPLERGLGNLVGGALAGVSPFARGGAVDGGKVAAFAGGGVVGAPTLFPLGGGGLGLMGEAGPEAILPLRRGPDGRLGVGAPAPGNGPVTVNMSIRTPDVEGFARARGRIAAELARAVDRGRRNL